jgi:ribonuclease HII
VVKGDSLCLSIACASIVAKVARDREMERLSQEHPGYGWERNAGYGTAEHLEALKRLGATPLHRRSFRPVRESLNISY